MSDELSKEELDEHGSEQLPEREEMALINANLAAPVNAAVAANVLSDDSTAIADATQNADSARKCQEGSMTDENTGALPEELPRRVGRAFLGTTARARGDGAG